MGSDNQLYKEEFKKVHDSIKSYPEQLLQSWNEVFELKIPDSYQKVENIVFCGMGGSALGARMVDAFAVENRLRIPFEIFTGYHLPEYTSSNTLVVLSSYSGNTEEVVNCAHEVYSKNAKVFGITTGGKLEHILTEHNTPVYVFDPINNPSNQPRMATGYSSGAVLALLAKLGMLHVTREEVEDTARFMGMVIKELDEDIPKANNIAVSLFKKIDGKLPVLVASEHLVGVSHALKNSFNENAKTFAVLFDLPELNHHLMEGLAHPKQLKTLLHFIFIESEMYSDRVKKRYPITMDVVDQNNIDYSVYKVQADTKLSQMYEVLVVGSFVIYYLTKSLNINPTAIPWVDYFKEKLS